MSESQVQKKQANKKKQQKQISKEQKYKNLLEKIDIQLDEQQNDPKKALELYMNKQEKSKNDDNNNKEISIGDLMSRLEEATEQKIEQSQKVGEVKKTQQQQSGEQLLNSNSNTQNLRKQMEDLNRKQVLQEPESLGKQEQRERQANYAYVKDDMKKWIPIVKRNREADHIDFTEREVLDNNRVNAVLGNDLNHKIAKNIEETLKKGNIDSEKSVVQKEKPLSSEQQNMLKERNLLFYSELKHKRVAKIKSKMYHRIKNKKKQKQVMAGEQVNVQQLEEEQIRERIQQRHKTKGKNLRTLMKYGDKKSIQQVVTSNAEMRKQILTKILKLDQQDAEDYDPEDDNAFREKAIKELEKELMETGEGGDNKKTGLKFIDSFNDNKRNEAMEEAKKLLQKLKENENIDDLFSDEEEFEDEEQKKENGKAKNIKRKKSEQKDEEFEGRKTYKPNDDDKKKGNFEMEVEEDAENDKNYKKMKNQDAGKILKDFMKDKEEEQHGRIEFVDSKSKNDNLEVSQIMNEKKFENKKVNGSLQDELEQQKTVQQQKQQTMKKTVENNHLTQGINIGKLQDKYRSSSKGIEQFNIKDLETFDIENREEIYKDLSNFNILVDNENEEEFMKEKYEDYEKQIVAPVQKKQGWGSWAGHGIQKKPEPTKEELLRKKQQMIEDIKRKRQDGKMDNVIKRESRNKLVTQYLVKELPYQYNNAQQFEYMNNTPIGSEWNTMQSTQKLIQPKIKTKVGQIIKPVTEPKRQQK